MNQVDDAKGTEQKQLVVFHLAGEIYGVDIHKVREIIRIQQITRVPKTPDFVEGILNLRGGVIPVIDLRKRLNLEVQEAGNDARIVVIEQEDQTIGMIVDQVSQVMRIDPTTVEPPSPFIVSLETRYISGIAKLPDQLVVLLDLNQVLTEYERDQLSQLAMETDQDFGEGFVSNE